MSGARNHHWVPQGYLRGFSARPAKKNAQVFVVDIAEKRYFTTSVRNVCSERDFNRIEAPGLPADALETELSKFEDQATEALRRINIRPDAALGSHDWDVVLNLMAMMATRNPTSRQRRTARASKEILRIYDDATASKEQWEATVAGAKAAGHIDPAADTSYERHRDFIAQRRFKLTFGHGFHLPGEFHAMGIVLQWLARRRWLYLVASTTSHGFITTDRPVTVCPLDGSLPTAVTRFDDPRNAVMFAISPRVLAYGTAAGREGTTEIDRRLVAKANLTLMQYAETRLFAPHDRFEVNSLKPGTPYLAGAEVLKIIAERVEFSDL